MGQKRLSIPVLLRHPQKIQNPKLSNFVFNLYYKSFRIFEGLNRSLAQSLTTCGWICWQKSYAKM